MQLEECYDSKPVRSESGQFCESYFTQTVKRELDGRFVVSIPFKENLSNLGESRENAVKRFMAMERKLHILRNESLRHDYV